MPTYVSAGDSKAFEPAPEGLWPLVCCDVVDKGEVTNQWGTKPKVQLRWQLGEEAGVRDDGKPWLVTRTFTASLFKLAELSKLLVRWRGRAFTDEELKRFDLDTIIGVVGLGNIVHNTSDDGITYANVDTVVPLPKTMKKPTIRDYVRQQDREPQATWKGGTPEEREMEEAFAGTIEEKNQTTPQPPGVANAELLEAIDKQGIPDRASKYQLLLSELGYNPLTEMVIQVQKFRTGKRWIDLSPADQDALINAAEIAKKNMLAKKALDAQAAKEE